MFQVSTNLTEQNTISKSSKPSETISKIPQFIQHPSAPPPASLSTHSRTRRSTRIFGNQSNRRIQIDGFKSKDSVEISSTKGSTRRRKTRIESVPPVSPISDYGPTTKRTKLSLKSTGSTKSRLLPVPSGRARTKEAADRGQSRADQSSRARSKNSSINNFIPDGLSPIVQKKGTEGKKIAAADVMKHFGSGESSKSATKNTTTFKPLLLRSKPSTDGFKMPKRKDTKHRFLIARFLYLICTKIAYNIVIRAIII